MLTAEVDGSSPSLQFWFYVSLVHRIVEYAARDCRSVLVSHCGSDSVPLQCGCRAAESEISTR